MSLTSIPDGSLTVADGRARALAVAAALRRAARKSREPVSLISGGGGFRARKGDRLFRLGMIVSLIIFVACPVIVASTYFGLVASDQYLTEVQFSLRSGEGSVLDSLSGMAGLASSQQNLDSQIIVNFIPSRAMVEQLDKALDLRRIYSRADVDWFARFNPKRPVEELVKYWEYRVDASLDPQSSIIKVKVRAFTPEDSLALGNKIYELSERLVNDMMARSREDSLRSAKGELDRAEASLVEATEKMQQVRNTEGVLDAKLSAEALLKIMGALQLQEAKLKQLSAVTSRSMGPDSPQVKINNAQIEDIRNQMAKIQAQMAGNTGNGDRTLADAMGALSRYQIEVKVAQERYASASVSFERARMEQESQHAYLIKVVPPLIAEKALYPRRWWNWSLIVFPSILLWSILAGLAFLVRDHMAG